MPARVTAAPDYLRGGAFDEGQVAGDRAAFRPAVLAAPGHDWSVLAALALALAAFVLIRRK